jgi:xanthine dehydrogenase YagS FAD-binding subunit
MQPFEMYDPTSVEEAVSMLRESGGKAKVIAGGSDLLGLVKDRVQRLPNAPLPEVLVNLESISGLSYIREDADGLKIGAMTPLTEIENSELILQKYPILAKAAAAVASPTFRNFGTLGGNLNQRPRCWYFRGPAFTSCYKRGGDFCYAVTGENQFHAILEGELCYIVHPSDGAVALIALGASGKIVGPNGEKVVPFDDYFVGPRTDVLRENILSFDEILTEVQVPAPPANSVGEFLKVKIREVYDFAISAVAVQLTMDGSTVKDARVVLGGVAPTPLRATAVEAALVGQTMSESLAEKAGQIAVQGARPMSYNAYKVPMTANLVKRALMATAA